MNREGQGYKDAKMEKITTSVQRLVTRYQHTARQLRPTRPNLKSVIIVHDSKKFWQNADLPMLLSRYSTAPLIRINWDDEPSGYADIPDN
jgi:hypothetical protein